MKIETRAVHAGRQIDPATGAVTPPICLSTTFERSPEGEYPRGFIYSRDNNPNRRALEECLADLEGGTQALAFSSGLAVATAVVQGLEADAHIVAPDDVYWGFRKVVGGVFERWPVEATYVDMTDLEAVRAAIRPSTRLIWVETPSNPLMKVTDLAAIAKLAQAAEPKVTTVCDGTFATPVLQRPLELGIDLVAHSTTKYIGGHSDVIGGALIAGGPSEIFDRARVSQKYGGSVPSPFDCWLTLRGLDTFPYRVRAQSENGMKVARFLAAHRAVATVHYPGLEQHPGHAIAARQMSAFGGMLSFEVRGGRDRAMGVVARCKLFIRATSLGGAHSLIEHRASVEGPESKTPQSLIRLSIGLEHIDDLTEDLAQALEG
ncbi:MAG TPA: aminotransferase class I/II-fold pyridoxal phosphate-dependent enzyme [Bryobacteraceae bacterium]|jgi:cystathionine gamma-synthase|nr:aminotransferase class I/II-fold pyridoxal phosphate-dependent enzyme [Bryobacteraceae bacterium]